jgi:hypothetical protein
MSLLLHYKMNDDEANTTVLDASGNGLHGTLHGGVNTEDISESGKIDKALHFDGSADYILRAADASLPHNNLTVMAWLKSDVSSYETNIYPVAMYDSVGNKRMWALRITNGNQKYTWVTSADGVAIAYEYFNVVVDTNWHHFAVLWNDTTKVARLLLDGTTLYTLSALSYSIGNLGSHLTIGGLSSAGYFDGLIDDVRLYDEQLTLGQIKRIYNAGLGTENTLAELYAKNEGPIRPVIRIG